MLVQSLWSVPIGLAAVIVCFGMYRTLFHLNKRDDDRGKCIRVWLFIFCVGTVPWSIAASAYLSGAEHDLSFLSRTTFVSPYAVAFHASVVVLSSIAAWSLSREEIRELLVRQRQTFFLSRFEPDVIHRFSKMFVVFPLAYALVSVGLMLTGQ